MSINNKDIVNITLSRTPESKETRDYLALKQKFINLSLPS
jgi:hypothetical protein